MARSDIVTGLPLDQWAEIMGIGPWEFNQIGNGIDYHREAQCDTVFYQFSWQMKFINRREIAQSIARAENALAPLLNFFPYPKYFTDEIIPYKRTTWPHLPNYSTARAQWKPVKTKFQNLQALGTLKRTLILAADTYVSSDEDGDAVNDTFTLTVATTITDVNQLALYFAVVDRKALNETWRIRPLRITADGTTATFVGHLSQLVDPVNNLLPDPLSLDATDPIYVLTLDVYQVETDTSDIGTGVWAGHIGISDASAAIGSSSIIIDSEAGYCRPIVSPTLFRRSPDHLLMNYRAGIPYDETGRMQEPFASMVTYLSCQYMPGKKCGCERSDQTFVFWASLPSDDASGGQRPISISEIDLNPLGQSRGAIYAFNQVKEYQEAGGVAI